MNADDFHVAVVGAGIIGISTACFLAERGVRVTVVDPFDPGEGGASKANAAHVFPGIVSPLASPAVLKNAPRLLLDPASPLSIPARYCLQMLPWLAEFALACRRTRYERGVAALTEFNRGAYAHFESLLQRAGRSDLLARPGAIQLYESVGTLRAGIDRLSRVPSQLTGGIRVLQPDALATLEPAVAPLFAGGVLLPNTGVLADPLETVRALADYARRMGAAIERGRVEAVRLTDGMPVLRLESGRQIPSHRAVIAAGAWSKKLSAQLGERVRLETERGYNLTVRRDEKIINHALVFADRSVVATQLKGAVRLGGFDELGGLSLPPNPKLFDRLRRIGADVLPGVDWDTARQWMGHRPSMPDSLPVIGRSKRHENVLYAFGHGHLGMTHGPITGATVAALATDGTASVDISSFALR